MRVEGLEPCRGSGGNARCIFNLCPKRWVVKSTLLALYHKEKDTY